MGIFWINFWKVKFHKLMKLPVRLVSFCCVFFRLMLIKKKTKAGLMIFIKGFEHICLLVEADFEKWTQKKRSPQFLSAICSFHKKTLWKVDVFFAGFAVTAEYTTALKQTNCTAKPNSPFTILYFCYLLLWCAERGCSKLPLFVEANI